MFPGNDDQGKVAAAGGGHLRASHADREQVIGALKAAFVQGRLTRDEFQARIGQALTARTFAELAVLTADIPPAPDTAQQLRQPARRPVSPAARWCASGAVTPVILVIAFASAALHHGGRYGAAAFVIAAGYFLCWLSAGADLLWEWHAAAVPGAGTCVRCAHTASSHRAPASCSARQGSPGPRNRCACAGYVPPGMSPKAADLLR